MRSGVATGVIAMIRMREATKRNAGIVDLEMIVMSSKFLRIGVVFFTLAALSTAVFGDELIPIGDPGNPPDASNSDKVPAIGSVAYRYRIGKYEVTNAEYAAMLNAVAKDDPHALYFEKMGTDPFGGIVREGDAGSYKYTTKAGMERKPVVFVRFDDAARYCNWLHNGQPVGAQGPATTEDGAYQLVPGKPVGRRKEGAKFFVPNENEWYKAAYYDPNKGGPGVGGYWNYPTRSDTPPAAMAPNATHANSANYANAARGLTEVGGYSKSPSAYGVFDMAGNVTEWNETMVTGLARGLRGGAWRHDAKHQVSSERTPRGLPMNRNIVIGFRIAARE